MKRRVYLETTIASYLTARPNRDLVIAAHQELTLEWWADHRQRFDTFVSDFVLSESAKGDPSAAARRLAELKGIPVLRLDDEARELARAFVARRLIPRKCLKTRSMLRLRPRRVWTSCSLGTAATLPTQRSSAGWRPSVRSSGTKYPPFAPRNS